MSTLGAMRTGCRSVTTISAAFDLGRSLRPRRAAKWINLSKGRRRLFAIDAPGCRFC